MTEKKITIIGGGNLGRAIAEGLLSGGHHAAASITITRRQTAKLADLAEQGVQVTADNAQAASTADVIVLAIKPHQIIDVLREINPVLRATEQMLISVVTGVSIAEMQEVCGERISLFRAMPNTAIAIRESMTCVATSNASAAEQDYVVQLFNKLGKAVMINEEYMQAATVLAACGVAYSLRYIRAASQGGIEIGFDAQTAQLIAAQTVKGSASLLLEQGRHPESEIDKVTTPMGCTIAGLNEMEHQGFSSALIKGILTSFYKIADIKK